MSGASDGAAALRASGNAAAASTLRWDSGGAVSASWGAFAAYSGPSASADAAAAPSASGDAPASPSASGDAAAAPSAGGDAAAAPSADGDAAAAPRAPSASGDAPSAPGADTRPSFTPSVLANLVARVETCPDVQSFVLGPLCAQYTGSVAQDMVSALLTIIECGEVDKAASAARSLHIFMKAGAPASADRFCSVLRKAVRKYTASGEWSVLLTMLKAAFNWYRPDASLAELQPLVTACVDAIFHAAITDTGAAVHVGFGSLSNVVSAGAALNCAQVDLLIFARWTELARHAATTSATTSTSPERVARECELWMYYIQAYMPVIRWTSALAKAGAAAAASDLLFKAPPALGMDAVKKAMWAMIADSDDDAVRSLMASNGGHLHGRLQSASYHTARAARDRVAQLREQDWAERVAAVEARALEAEATAARNADAYEQARAASVDAAAARALDAEATAAAEARAAAAEARALAAEAAAARNAQANEQACAASVDAAAARALDAEATAARFKEQALAAEATVALIRRQLLQLLACGGLSGTSGGVSATDAASTC